MHDDQEVRHAYADWPEIEEEAESAAAEVCCHLRTKTAYGTLVGGAHKWHEGRSSTAVYWCLATLGSAGPDQQLAHPRRCSRTRECYRET
jgi:hypothetical protein